MVKLDLNIFCFLWCSYACLFVSLGQGKRVTLRMKLNPDGQLDLNDPEIRSNILAKVKVISSVCSEMLQKPNVLMSSHIISWWNIAIYLSKVGLLFHYSPFFPSDQREIQRNWVWWCYQNTVYHKARNTGGKTEQMMTPANK